MPQGSKPKRFAYNLDFRSADMSITVFSQVEQLSHKERMWHDSDESESMHTQVFQYVFDCETENNTIANVG